MLQRELTRIGGCAIAGELAGIAGWLAGSGGISLLIMVPLYMIGLFYGGSWLLHSFIEYLKTVFQATVFIHNFWGVAVVLLAIVIGIPTLIVIGWLAGLARAVLALHEAWEADQFYHLKHDSKKRPPSVNKKQDSQDDEW